MVENVIQYIINEMKRLNEKGKPAERQGRKASGLRQKLWQPGYHEGINPWLCHGFFYFTGIRVFSYTEREGERVWRNSVLPYQEMF